MVAGKANFIIERDADFDPTITWKDSAGTPVPVTGASALLTMNYTLNGTPGTFAISSNWNPNGYITVGGSNGLFTLLIPATTTKTMTWANGVYNMQVIQTNQKVTRLLEGGVVVRPAVGEIV